MRCCVGERCQQVRRPLPQMQGHGVAMFDGWLLMDIALLRLPGDPDHLVLSLALRRILTRGHLSAVWRNFVSPLGPRIGLRDLPPKPCAMHQARQEGIPGCPFLLGPIAERSRKVDSREPFLPPRETQHRCPCGIQNQLAQLRRHTNSRNVFEPIVLHALGNPRPQHMRKRADSSKIPHTRIKSSNFVQPVRVIQACSCRKLDISHASSSCRQTLVLGCNGHLKNCERHNLQPHVQPKPIRVWV